MRRNTTKMHTFYTADAQEHDKNASRGCFGAPGRQGKFLEKKPSAGTWGNIFNKKAILTVFGPFRTKCPKSVFFKDIDCAVQTPRTQENTCIL